MSNQTQINIQWSNLTDFDLKGLMDQSTAPRPLVVTIIVSFVAFIGLCLAVTGISCLIVKLIQKCRSKPEKKKKRSLQNLPTFIQPKPMEVASVPVPLPCNKPLIGHVSKDDPYYEYVPGFTEKGTMVQNEGEYDHLDFSINNL